MYPTFNLFGKSKVYTILKDFHCESLGNNRDISVYVPESYYENNVRRKFNVLILLGIKMDFTNYIYY
jgi:hypothetical protein